MNKRFFNALLYGALVFSSGTFFVSCSDDDNSDLENRVSVLEGLIDDIKLQLSKAITVGATVTNWDAEKRIITLNDGTKIDLGAGGGEASNITVGDGFIIISIGGTEYALPMATTVKSLVYCPEFTDGIVAMDGKGVAVVRFLATPAVSADALSKATFTVADARLVETRAGEDLIKVTKQELEDDLIKVTLQGLGVEADKTYVVSLLMSQNEKPLVSSNYFYVKVADDFSFNSEELVDPKFEAAVTDATKEGEFWVATLPDGNGDVPNFLGEFSFKDFVSVEGDVVYELAPKSKQNQNVQDKYDFLKKCLSADGKWKMTGRPGTNCDPKGEDDADKPGLLVYLKVNEVTKAKVYFKVIDPWKDLDFKALSGLPGNFEAELYGRSGEYVPVGKSELDIPAILNQWEELIPIRHTGDDWFNAFVKYDIKDANGNSLVYNDGTKLVMSDDAKKMCKLSRGIFWYYRGVSIRVPETLAVDDGKYTDSKGNKHSGGEGFDDYDAWGSGNPADYASNPTGFYSTWGKYDYTVNNFPWTLSPEGILTFTEDFPGYGMRLAFAAGLEYDYGVKDLTGAGADQFGMLFINRRVSADDAKMPDPAPWWK